LKIFILLFGLLFSFICLAAKDLDPATFKRLMNDYSQGKYGTVADELGALRIKFRKQKKAKVTLKTRALLAYWQGMAFNRLQEFNKAAESFEAAWKAGHDAQDLNYEYGQALFAIENFKMAKIQFNESFKKGFKMGACLYYLAYVSKELGEEENARNLYSFIKKLPPNESKDVLQASELQLADMNLEEAEKGTDAVNKVKHEIIPTYEQVLLINPTSPLAARIKEKITSLQKKYELILFNLRNGRPTVLPRYFLRLAQEIGYDSNVVYAPTETTITSADQASLFTKTEGMGRYTFYHKNFLSIAPEMRVSYSRYDNRVDRIIKNDNLLLAPAVRTSYEHTLWNKPASTIFDYEFGQVQRDIQAQRTLDFASRAHTFSVGERFNYFSAGGSTVRLKYRKFTSYLDASNSSALGLTYEQIVSLKLGTLMLFSSFDRTRVNTSAFDSNSITVRGDWIMPAYKGINPSVGLAMTLNDPINDRAARGLEKLINPGIRLNKMFGKNWGSTMRFEHFENISKDKENFSYRKSLFALEIEYIY